MNKLTVLYEDNHIIVVIKDANILSQKDHTNDIDMVTIIKNYLKEKYHKPGNVYLGLVHRLDRPTEGVMVFAKTSKAAARLSKQIKTHQFRKKYLAVVHYKIKEEQGRWEDYLKREENGNTTVSTKEDGKLAILEYKVLDYHEKDNKTLVEVNLKTGRHHQIRVQFASRGYSLCGDQRYGKDENTQLALIAYQLEFFHPVTKEQLCFTYKSTKNKSMSIFTM